MDYKQDKKGEDFDLRTSKEKYFCECGESFRNKFNYVYHIKKCDKYKDKAK